MVTMTTRLSLHGIGLALLFTFDYAASSQQTGILSNLYKKAAAEDRPLVLVLDSSLNSRSKNVDSSRYLDYAQKKSYDVATKKLSALEKYRDNDGSQKSLPYLLLQHLTQQYAQSKYQPTKSKAHEHSLTRSRLRSRNRDRLRLRSRWDDRFDLDLQDDRFDRDIRDDIDDWDRRIRDRRERRNRNRLLRAKKERDQIYRDMSLKDFIEKHLNEREPYEKPRDINQQRALRTSVIKNLLRISNDLNCDAQDECQDECDDKHDDEKKKDECDSKCETKFDCNDNLPAVDKAEGCGAGGEGCDAEDECADENDDCGKNDNPSTRGERYVEDAVTGCKRC